MPAGVDLEGISFENADQIRTTADPATGHALTARFCQFDGVRLTTTGSSERGPSLLFQSCQIQNTPSLTFANAGEIRFVNCEVRNNDARLAVGYHVRLEDCSVVNNRGTTPLIRGFVDLTEESRITLLRTDCFENETPLIEPQNVFVELEGCVFARNSGGILLIDERAAVAIRNSDFIANTRFAGSCLSFERRGEGNPSILVTRSIFAANRAGTVISGDLDTGLELSCSDVFANEAGDYVGVLAPFASVAGNISADPLFCGVETDDYDLTEDSPCAATAQPDCGTIGAKEAGCP